MKLLHYRLQCPYCGTEYADYFSSNFLLTCPGKHPPALLRAKYDTTSFQIQEDLSGLFRFASWLPVRRLLPDSPAPVVFHSDGFGSHVGLNRLWFAFSGYWPEKGAFMTTCTFKELEALVVCARIPAGISDRLVVASAGNTARAFLQVCSEHNIPLVVVVPEAALPLLWLTSPKASCVKIVAVAGEADYFDAIQSSSVIAQQPGFFPEGGGQNVARRDGLGTVLLALIEATGRMPQHYFQAVGSGTGGIAVWEAGERIRQDGRFGDYSMRLHLAQNAPFTPLVDAWHQRTPTLIPLDESQQKAQLRKIRAQVLSNRQPLYEIVGGVYDALRHSNGFTYAVSNAEAERAGAMFLELEGCDLDPAAEVTLASLLQAVKMGLIMPDDIVLVNLTGGGYHRLKQEHVLYPQHPDATVPGSCLSVASSTLRKSTEKTFRNIFLLA